MSITRLPGTRSGTGARRLALVAVAAVLAISGCGGGDDDPRPELTAGGDSPSDSPSESSWSEPSESESTPSESESSEPAESETADVFDIAIGDCLGAAAEGEVSEVTVVPCEAPHDSEAYFAVQMDDAPSFPGEDVVDTASEGCLTDGFTAFVGIAYESSVFQVSTLAPTEESWSGGDREILCLLVDPAGPVAGSQQGSNR